jgi:hypothetical protein
LHQAVLARAIADDKPDVIEAAREALADVERVLVPNPRMDRLAQRLLLDAEQVEYIWAGVACSIDGRIVPHLQTLGGGHARRGLSLAVYAMLAELEDDTTARLAQWLAIDNPLLADDLLIETEEVSPASRAYVASPRLASYLAGDDRLATPLALVSVPSSALHDPKQSAAIDQIEASLVAGANPIVIVEGPRGSGRATACACATTSQVIVLDLARIAAASLADALVGLRSECLLRDAIPVIANIDLVLGDERLNERLLIGNFVDAIVAPLVATSTVRGIDIGTTRAVIRVPWEVANNEVRAELWGRAVHATGAELEGDLSQLAHRYQVGPRAIQRAMASVRMLDPGASVLSTAQLAAGLRHNIAERLAGLAQRVEVSQSWADLVLADDIRDHIMALIGRIVHSQQVLDSWGYRRKIARGAGMAALFSGPPGTGKTMVAGLIARELDVELYQVDLSKVVSKWVGETEKNLGRIFDAAEEGHGLLLFDEADALFGQRSADIKGSNDRYANLEVNYLLQRIEAFGGIAILTTNLETAIDSALKRRLAAHVVFDLPDEEERALLWQRQATTGSAPLDGRISFERLARDFPKMSGANIRNAAIAAAFLAAGEKATAITEDHLYRAARAEYRSMGHVIADTRKSRSL